ncbi:MAG: hypothetical protein Q8S73_22900 [Deltaproteobacteria bacterium]|nr:hypothetical protein [Myxococcales bacterium]MDP3216978.1 hypothetical protein [Deltaproteobacteria bacterium]
MKWTIALSIAVFSPGVAAQTSGPLNASPASVQVPATAVFLEQGTAGSSVTANVGSRIGDVAISLGLRTGDAEEGQSADLLTATGGLVDNGRVSFSIFWARFRTDRDLAAAIVRICNRHMAGLKCGEQDIRNDRVLFSDSERDEVADIRQASRRYGAFGGGPTVLFARGSIGRSSVDFFNETTRESQSDTRALYDFRLGVGRYVFPGGLLAFSMGYASTAQTPTKRNICENHLVGGMTTTPPTLECRDRYLTGLAGRQTVDLRLEWRQYLGAHFAWNPSITLPWTSRDDDAATPTNENVLRIEHIDLESPVYARLGTDLQLHVGVRPSMRIWTGAHAGGQVQLDLSVFVGGAFSLLSF